MEYPRFTRAPVEPIQPEVGVRKPYLWVMLWVFCLVIIAVVAWYFMIREKDITIEDIMNLNKGEVKGPSTIPQELRKIIIENSSAVPGATSTIPDELRKIILEQSSAVVETKDTKSSIPKRTLDAILKSSSAKP